MTAEFKKSVEAMLEKRKLTRRKMIRIFKKIPLDFNQVIQIKKGKLFKPHIPLRKKRITKSPQFRLKSKRTASLRLGIDK